MTDFFKSLVESSNGGVYIIAEACDNHMGSIDIAYALVDAAKFAGADAVKFQHHLVDVEMIRNNSTSDNFKEPLHQFLERNALTLQAHEKIKKYCDSKKITYMCTPFSFEAAKQINHLVDFFKIGSGEFQDYWFIDKLAKLNKPVIFSSGMCSDLEIQEWYKRNHKKFPSISILNCISEYPPKFGDMNLGYIPKLIAKTDCVIGHSDHTKTFGSSIVAVANGARILEKHLSISDFVDGPDSKVSLTPESFRMLVREARLTREMLGDKKITHERELPIRTWAYRSIVTSKDLSPGHIINADDICTKRPGVGIPSKDYERILGSRVLKDVKENSILSLSDIELQ